MKNVKKLIASLLAVSSMALCMAGISASAYTDMSYDYICKNTISYSSSCQTTSVSGSASSTDGNTATLGLYNMTTGSQISPSYSLTVYNSPQSFKYSSLSKSNYYRIGVSSAVYGAKGHVTAIGA